MRSSRRAEISKNLIILLVVAALAAGVFWIYKCRSDPSESAENAKFASAEKAKIYCPECKKEFEIPAAEAEKLPRDKKAGLVQCPECKKMVAHFGSAPPADDGPVMP